MSLKRNSLLELRQKIIECHSCSLREHYDSPVPFAGNPDAPIFLVGEAPGEDEVKQGKPFVGRAGKLLRKALLYAGYDMKNDVFIGNVICCRPPNNKFPTDRGPIDACTPWVIEAIELVDPQLVVALGGKPHQLLMGSSVGITRAAGIWGEWNGRPYLPTLHPSFCLRPGNKDGPNEIMAMGPKEKSLLLAEHLKEAREKAMKMKGEKSDG